MHNAAMAAMNLNWRYMAFDVPPAEIATVIQGARAMRLVGLNFTVPHKLLALEMCDELDTTARNWGAVNTIRFEARDPDGRWLPLADLPTDKAVHVRAHGFNTDADAIIRALHEDLQFDPAGRSVTVLGSGGAGRVAALRLAAEGVATLHLVNRTLSKIEQLAAEIREKFPQVTVFLGYPPDGRCDLVLNATSLGLKPEDAMPLDAGRLPFSGVQHVYDMVYQPAETPLLREAKAAGCRTANGLGMLLYQGAKALEIWSGQAAPVEIMRQALMHHIYGKDTPH